MVDDFLGTFLVHERDKFGVFGALDDFLGVFFVHERLEHGLGAGLLVGSVRDAVAVGNCSGHLLVCKSTVIVLWDLRGYMRQIVVIVSG